MKLHDQVGGQPMILGHVRVAGNLWIEWACIAVFVFGWMYFFSQCEKWSRQRLAEMREEENEPPDPRPFKRSEGQTKPSRSARRDDLDS